METINEVLINGKTYVPKEQEQVVARCERCDNVESFMQELDTLIQEMKIIIQKNKEIPLTATLLDDEGFIKGLMMAEGTLKEHLGIK